jgi:hypothetical protein
MMVSACSAGPYQDLQSRFRSDSPPSGRSIPSKTVVLISKSHSGAFNYRDTIDVRFAGNTVEIRPTGVFAFGLKPLRIPRSAVTLCSETCFGSSEWDANLLLSDPPVEISVRKSQDVIDWCWANRIPIASGKARRDWMYGAAPLPAMSTLEQQLASRDSFDRAARQACLGY